MQTVYLDISCKGVYPCIQAKQQETGRKFAAVLTDGGVPFNVPEDAVLSVWYSGASGEGNYSDIGGDSAISVEGNTLTVELIEQMVVNAGFGVLCIRISSPDGSLIGLWNIPYSVEGVPGCSSQKAEEYYTAFSEAAANLALAAKTFTPDKTLSKSGAPADAAETGRQIAVERERINELVAMDGVAGIGEFEISGSGYGGIVITNGVYALLELSFTSVSIAAGESITFADFPAQYAPIGGKTFKCDTASGITLEITAPEDGAELTTLILTNNYDEAFTEYVDFYIEYPLGSISIPELADLRIGHDGTKYPTAGEAVRAQLKNVTLSVFDFAAMGMPNHTIGGEAVWLNPGDEVLAAFYAAMHKGPVKVIVPTDYGSVSAVLDPVCDEANSDVVTAVAPFCIYASVAENPICGKFIIESIGADAITLHSKIFLQTINGTAPDANGNVKLAPCTTGIGAPTTETEGAVGMLYMDTATNKLYICINVVIDGYYVWRLIRESNISYVDVAINEDDNSVEWVSFGGLNSANDDGISEIWSDIQEYWGNAKNALFFCRVHVEDSNEIFVLPMTSGVGSYSNDINTYVFSGVVSAEGGPDKVATFKIYAEGVCEYSTFNVVKTVNGTAPDENGNVEIPSAEGAVLYTEQTLTDEEKEQARNNIGAAEQGEYGIKIKGKNADVSVSIEPGIDADDTGYRRSKLIFLGEEDDTVRLCRITNGKQDDDAATVGQLNTAIGDISTALDAIISMQEELIGV